jgi:hypothetical protein
MRRDTDLDTSRQVVACIWMLLGGTDDLEI